MSKDGRPENAEERRRGTASASPDAPADGSEWLRLSDDDLLYEIQTLAAAHEADAHLLEVVKSARHFFIRQEAAKRVRNHDRLKAHSGDRHIGQILVRGLNRTDDVAYLERLLAESRHIEVKKAAEAQLRAIARARTVPKLPTRS
jgi:hypothetical protein